MTKALTYDGRHEAEEQAIRLERNGNFWFNSKRDEKLGRACWRAARIFRKLLEEDKHE